MIILVIVFCFKQKTAYEMRISDWSSDVCSSDLQSIPAGSRRIRIRTCQPAAASARTRWRPMKPVAPVMATTGASATAPGSGGTHALECTFEIKLTCAGRSEEHTSELQSLMRISYAVFCLKKKKIKTTRTKDTDNKAIKRTKEDM